MFNGFPVKRQLGIGFATVVGFLVATLLIVGFLIPGLTQDVGEANDRSLSLTLAVDELHLTPLGEAAR